MKRREDFSPLTQDVLYGTKRGLFEDELGRSLLDIYQYNVCDERTAGMIHQRVRKDKLAQAFSGVPFLSPRLSRGEIILGFDLDGRPIRIPIQYLNAHGITVAGTGAGKTTRAKFTALQVAPKVAGMWLIDLRKREFRMLRPLFSRVGIDLIVLPARSLRVNPLQVPLGVEPTEWIPRVADMLIQVLGLPPRASKLVQVKLFELYRRFGVI
jgi:hypothetical protein